MRLWRTLPSWVMLLSELTPNFAHGYGHRCTAYHARDIFFSHIFSRQIRIFQLLLRPHRSLRLRLSRYAFSMYSIRLLFCFFPLVSDTIDAII